MKSILTSWRNLSKVYFKSPKSFGENDSAWSIKINNRNYFSYFDCREKYCKVRSFETKWSTTNDSLHLDLSLFTPQFFPWKRNLLKCFYLKMNLILINTKERLSGSTEKKGTLKSFNNSNQQLSKSKDLKSKDKRHFIFVFSKIY